MKRYNWIISATALLLSLPLSAPLVFGQSTANPDRPVNAVAGAGGNSGVTVEMVSKNFEADKAGVREGDVLLHWSRGNNAGEIESPFDLSQIEIEQAPHGAVTIEGLRGSARQVWTVGPSDWSLKTRPSLPAGLFLLYRQGQEFARAGKLTKAAERWRQLAKRINGSQPAWLRPWLRTHTADAFAEARQWNEADAAYQKAMQQALGAGPAIKTQLFRAWAKTAEQRADWVGAEKHYQDAAEESRKLNSESLTFAENLAAIGLSAFHQRDLDEAEKYLSHAREIQQRLAPGSLPLARSLKGFGLVAWIRGSLDEAEEYYRQALEIQQKLAPDGLDLARTLNNLGNIAEPRGDLAKAEEYFRQAFRIEQKLVPDSIDAARTLNNLGLVAKDRGEFAGAEEYYRRALAIWSTLAPGGLDFARTLGNLGVVLALRGDLSKSDELFRQELAINKRLAPGGIDFARSLGNLGALASLRGTQAKAEEFFRQELIIDEKLAPGGIDVAQDLTNIGDTLMLRGDPVQAEGYELQALGIREKLVPGSLYAAENLANLGEIARIRGNNVKAEECDRRALAIREKVAPGSSDHAETLAALGGIMLRKGQLDAAEPLFKRSLDVLENQIGHLGGSMELRSDFRAKYLSYYQDYIDLLIRQRQPEQAFHILERSRARTLVEMLAEAHIDVRKGVAPALLEQERSLAADITAKTNRRIQLLSDKHTDQQVAAVDQEIEKLLAQRKGVEEQVRTSSPGYAALTQPQPLSVKEVQQQLLDDDTLLLAYSVGEDRSYVFAVTTNSLQTYELPKRTDIENAARQVHDLVGALSHRITGEGETQRQARLSEREKKYGEASTALSQMVLGPVATQLQQKRLLIVADGALQYISFAALPTPTPAYLPAPAGRVAWEARSLERGSAQPLVVEHEIVSLPATSVLAVLRREAMGRKQAPKAVAVLADPVFAASDVRVSGGRVSGREDGVITRGLEQEEESSAAASGSVEHLTRSVNDLGLQMRRGGPYLPRLPFSRREALAILSITPAGQGLKALDFQASRATATDPELAQYRILHFATHGLLNNEHPELSGLVFSLVDQHGKPQNGFLELQDIYNLNLSADLVVLSACETGLGKEVRGEGLVGLSRGFMYAGASRVLATLWSVDDVATAELMGRFYKAMEQQGMSPAAALRQAQVAMSKQERWQDPYYWGGFVLQGDWK